MARKRWSAKVTRESDALDLDEGVFTRTDPRSIARSLKRSAERSDRRKSDPYRSAMSMLTFYINRAGKALPAAQRKRLDTAKDELRALFERPKRTRKTATRLQKATKARRAPKKTSRKTATSRKATGRSRAAGARPGART
jgi:hypothetical protein